MKKLISILLVTVMLAAMIPAAALTATATEAEPAQSGNWTDAGNYDISWCKTLDTADSSKTVTVDGTHYYVKGDWTNQTYTVDTPAKLAGFAYLSNLAGADCFKGDQFIITADLDLGAHNWVPIAMTGNSKFRGSIIGQKGSVDGAVVTVSNMTIDNSASPDVESGLVGQFGGASIKNIDLKNATIKANNYTVGSFVGYQNGNISGSYEKLSSDAKITVTASRADRWDSVGGIVGFSNNGYTANGYKNCVFTGTIDAPYADLVGGILGTYEECQGDTDWAAQQRKPLTFENCVVVSESIKVGKNNYHGANNSDNDSGFGGILGRCTIDQADTNGNICKTTLKNCYVAINMFIYTTEGTNQNRNVGGFIGNIWGNATDIIDCQFDGIITGDARRVGSTIGRMMCSDESPLTYNDCVITGIAFNGNDPEKKGYKQEAFTWHGRNTPNGWTIENCFTAFPQRVASGVTATLPTLITADTEFTGLDMENTWTTVQGSEYPILRVALPYYNAQKSPSVVNKGVDFGWLDFAASSLTVETEEQLDTFAFMIDAVSGQEEEFIKNIEISSELADVDRSAYSDKTAEYICQLLGIDPNAVSDRSKISVQFAQIAVAANVNIEKPDKNGTYNVRVVAKFTDPTVANVYFDYALVQNGAETKQAESAKITDCYRDVIKEVNGEQTVITAQDGYYVILDIYDVNFKDVTSSVVSVRAYATGADGTVYYSGNYVDITLTSPAAN